MTYSPRTRWSERSPKQITPHPMTSNGNPVSLIVLHHTVTPDAPFFPILTAIERDHLSGVYHDIAYNGAASNSSDDFTDLRGPTVQGGATGKNRNGRIVDAWSLSIVVPGDFETAGRNDPNPRFVVESVAQLIARWHSQGHVADDFTVEPHRDHYQLSDGTARTSCCGRRLMALIPDIEQRARELIGGDMAVPFIDDWNTWFNDRPLGGDPDFIVHDIEARLKRLGYDVHADGRKGAKTLAAVEQFKVDQFDAQDPNANLGTRAWARLRELTDEPAATPAVGIPSDAIVAGLAAQAIASLDEARAKVDLIAETVTKD